MKKLLKPLLIISALLVLVVSLFYLSLPYIVSDNVIKTKIMPQIEEYAEGRFSFESYDISYFPRFVLTFNDAQIVMENAKVEIESNHFDLYVDVFQILVGSLDVKDIQFRGADFVFSALPGQVFPPLKMVNSDFRIKSIPASSKKVVTFHGDWGEAQNRIEGQVDVEMSSFDSLSWREIGLAGNVSIKTESLKSLESFMEKKKAFEVLQGNLNADIEVSKEKGRDWSHFSSNISIGHFVYAVQGKEKLESDIMNVHTHIVVDWNPITEEFKFDKSRLDLPAGSIVFGGHIFGGTGEIQELRFSALDMPLEEIPNYWIGLKPLLPINFGFSGASNWDITLQGTWDLLTVHSNIDLTKSNLTYSRYFSKPRNASFAINFDAFLKKGKFLDSDFSLRFESALFKGNVKELDIESGMGQLNIITNKFQIADFGDFILPLLNYDFKGDAKFLLNWDGNLYDWKNNKKVLNVTLQEGMIARKNGLAIEDINLSMDYGVLSFESKEASMRINNAPITLAFKVYHLLDNPILDATFEADQLEPIRIFETLQDISLEWMTTEVGAVFENLKANLEKVFPTGHYAENIKATVEFKDQKLTIPEMNLKAYGGESLFSSELEFYTDHYFFKSELNSQGIDLQKFLKSERSETSWVIGELDLELKLSAQGPLGEQELKNPEGQGRFVVRNGAFTTFDLLDRVGSVLEFNMSGPSETATTPFDVLFSDFVIRDNKVLSERLLLNSLDYSVIADGHTSLDGLMNYRLDFYFSESRSRQFLRSYGLESQLKEGFQWGAVPVLVSGPLSHPELQGDPKGLKKILKDLSGNKPSKILRHFLRDRFLFEREPFVS